MNIIALMNQARPESRNKHPQMKRNAIEIVLLLEAVLFWAVALPVVFVFFAFAVLCEEIARGNWLRRTASRACLARSS